MYTYTNGFRISIKDDKSEVLVQFIQTLPDFSEEPDGSVKISGSNEEIVSSLVMSGVMASDLSKSLSNLFADGEKAE